MSTLAETRVAAGAAWLDGEAPGWERRVDLSVLDMNDVNLCVVGQVFAEWAEEADADADAGYDRAHYEFGWHGCCGLGFTGDGNAEPGVFTELAEVWTALIEERLGVLDS